MQSGKKGERGKLSGGLLLVIAIIGVAVTIAVGVYFAKTRGGSNVDVANREGTTQISVPQDQAKAKEHFEKGVNYSLKKEYDKAIAEYLESLRYNPDVSVAHSNLAFAYFDKGNLDLAILEHKKAIEIDPANSNAFYGMALIYDNMGNKTEAIRYWEQFKRLTEPHSLWWNKAQERLEKLKSNNSGG